MYDELVKRLRECTAEQNGEKTLWHQAADVIESTSKAYQMMAEAYEAEVTRPKWIPVTERLPEDKEMVLCFTPVDGYMFVGFYFSYKWGSNTVSKWRIITAMRSTKDITKKVTHWMPLPQAPKEET